MSPVLEYMPSTKETRTEVKKDKTINALMGLISRRYRHE